MSEQNYDVLIITLPRDFSRLKHLYYKMEENLPGRKIIFVGPAELGDMLAEANLGDRFAFLNEEDILPFENVKSAIEKVLGYSVTRGFVGWYYQQFLKMQYARMCKDEYYMTWDGDTIPIRKFEMIENGRPIIDWKREYHKPYFDTINKLFGGVGKVLEPSFISEHMLFSKTEMTNMMEWIEQAEHLEGDTFYERILQAVGKEYMNGNSYSEFETYGTYLVIKNPTLYSMRRWTSFRCCGQYFDPKTITEEDMEWLAKDFYALSFEKGHRVESGAEFFQNKEYQQKLTARQIVEIVQDEMIVGYKESWD